MSIADHSRLAVRYTQWATDFFVRVVRVMIWPKAELLIRIWVAKLFLVAATMHIMALHMGVNSPPFNLPPFSAGAAVGLVFGALFALGAMTRFAAAALAILAVATRLRFQALDSQLYLVAILGWYAIGGAGLWSIDALLSRGLRDSALPGARRLMDAFDWLTQHGKPAFQSVIRIWLASTLLVGAWHANHDGMPMVREVALMLPMSAASIVPWPLMMAFGCALLAGIGTRYLCAAMVVITYLHAMMGGHLGEAAYLPMVLALLFIDGPGWLSVDRALRQIIDNRFLLRSLTDPHTVKNAPRVVIIGAGFGGISCAKALCNARVAVTLIDRANYHLFQPLLYQVATAALSPGDIAVPIRAIFRDELAVRFHMGDVSGVDKLRRVVQVGMREIPYDFLVVATGATHSYFGHESWAQFAPGLKRVEHAIEIRRRILVAFERAETAASEEERRQLLTFLVVGGGPTGVELSGAIAELAKHGMEKEFRCVDPAASRIILVQSALRLLPTFPEALSANALRSLSALGVEVMLGSRVEALDVDGVIVDGKRIAAATVLWAAGVRASPAAAWLAVEGDSAGRIEVDPSLRVLGAENIFALGDTAASRAWQGRPVPGLAPAAKQGGAYVAKVIRCVVDGRSMPPAFRYRHFGSLATIGRKAAVADFGFLQLWGAPAWWLWGAIHLSFLVGVRNRVSTLLNWLWAYLSFGGIRLITADPHEASVSVPSTLPQDLSLGR